MDFMKPVVTVGQVQKEIFKQREENRENLGPILYRVKLLAKEKWKLEKAIGVLTTVNKLQQSLYEEIGVLMIKNIDENIVELHNVIWTGKERLRNLRKKERQIQNEWKKWKKITRHN
jgi:hypothetical protein